MMVPVLLIFDILVKICICIIVPFSKTLDLRSVLDPH
jgi:hypothetical protein